MYRKRTVRLNESQLRRIVSESVRRVLGESEYSGITLLAEIDGNRLDRLYYDEGVFDMDEDEYLSAYHLGYGDDCTVIKNLLKYAKQSGEIKNEQLDADEYNNIATNAYGVFNCGNLTAVVDNNDYFPTIYIFRK